MTEGIHYSKDFEAQVLGLCMLEATGFGRAYGLIKQEYFHVSDNALIYEAMRYLYDAGAPINILSVWQHLIETSAPLNCRIGVPNNEKAVQLYLVELTMNVVNSTTLEYNCAILQKMWRKRELLRLTSSGMDSTADERAQIRTLIDKATDIYGSEFKKDWLSMDELMYELIIHQNELKEGKKEFITSGFKAIDRLNGGFTPGQMIIIGARPSIGKSALMGKISTQIARKNKKVGIISLEMNNTEIAARLASLETSFDFPTIYRNLFTDEKEHERFYNTISKETIHLPIYVSDKTKVDVNEIKAKAAKLKYQHGLDILMVDYLQLVETESGNKNYNREQEVSRISRGLKLLAMEMQIPIVVLCQLNRGVTGRSAKERYPRLSDLRESGAIEQDADVVLMLHRDYRSGYEIHPETGNSTEFDADLLCLKWRNGAIFHLELDFEPTRMRFNEKPGNLIPVNFNPPPQHEEENPF